MRALIPLLALTLPASAQDRLALAFPVECTLGETCMIQQLMDHDPGPGVQDFLCGPMSYDGHQGTDIRLPDHEALAEGVAILAAADGTVRGTRNSVPDTGSGGYPEGQECGNGVVIDHADGWQTQYCHLAQGSVSVSTGDSISTGERIGEMGFSGNTVFPHLHLTVRHNGVVIDPFAPFAGDTCGGTTTPLWSHDVPLAQGGILSIGFAAGVPDYDAVQAGTADAPALSRLSDAIVIWDFFHGARAGDIVIAEILSPDGSTLHSQEITLERTQAQVFRASGLRRTAPLMLGTYTGRISLRRDGILLDTETTTVPVD
ncbi:M23 family metallopeptidase [Gymnodinialimonas ceratoperidinii]|uniref:M23 family metallopeptidase n=1 Tax=Gymnodinialimonas ceratoperidinii TaxID=2856823 RepID=A0A8F6TX11_9RHOB|nr:M23 family metallopeptidase [Gymnodinialimonas ceratoperidinii]QXT39271.1 M23 family metallopeptidase [Gymnodinialimonas ceratoperidinii]